VRIGIRVGIDHKRKVRRETLVDEIPEPTSSDASDPERDASVSQDGERVREALRQLKDYPRELIVLRYFGGFSAAELANVFNKSEVAIRKDLERARGKMRGFLAPWFEGSES
jgi:RNA polymerase sigma-70 factor (ECF subfamily)